MYTVMFSDGTIFSGGTLENSLWNEMPPKSITKLRYHFPTISVGLEGYETYNHLIEKRYIIDSNKTTITNIILLAHHGAYITKFIYNMKTQKLKEEITEIGKEYSLRGTGITGWKAGVLQANPLFYRIT